MRDHECQLDSVGTADAVLTRALTATEVVTSALHRLVTFGGQLGSTTQVLEERALRTAARLDSELAAGHHPGPLAGVPFGVKDMYDVEGVTTIAGSRILADDPPATKDAAAIERLEAAGAVLVATLRMDEFAYGFTSQNAHYGLIRNPHDTRRMAGGSSSGPAAAAAAGLVPLAIGSDSNGSIRVPAALCGVFSWKPTFGTVSRAGGYPFVDSLDCVGVMARSVADLDVSLEALQGPDPDDPSCRGTILPRGRSELRVGVLGGYFRQGSTTEVLEAVDRVAEAVGCQQTVELPHAAHARAAAQLVTACSGGQLHLDHLRQRGRDVGSVTRERLLAGALLPTHAYVTAQRFRRIWCAEIREAMRNVDVLLAPAVPFSAPLHEETHVEVDGEPFRIASALGVFTQPLSFAGLPVVTVPITLAGRMPVGVQIIARVHEDRNALQVATTLEATGTVKVTVPDGFRAS